MSPNKMRVAIAEACGWVEIEHGKWMSRLFKLGARQQFEPELPDFPNDLNAMAEAEKVLTKEQHQAFRNELAGICGFNYNRVDMSDPNHHRNYVSATAAQRAEAFLRTIGKWTDD